MTVTRGYAADMAGIAARMRLPALVQDALLAVFVTYFQIRGTLLVTPGQDVHRQLAEPAYLGYALLTASGLALLVRRRWPVAVLVFVVAVSLGYYAAGYPDGPGWVALFIALYTVTAQGDGRRSVGIAAASIAVLTVGWLILADLAPLNAAGWVFFRIGTAIMAAALGESVRTRKALVAEAHERAQQAERTREEEACRRVDAERLRIAREVHDTVAHAIAIINVHAGVTAHVLDKRPGQARAALATIEQTSARALGELRATLAMLHDVEEDDDRRSPPKGLGQLGELVAMARTAGLDLTVDVQPPDPRLPAAVDHAAYRILQESITNAVRHAGPARVSIAITCGPSDVEVRVADDGAARAGQTGETGGRGITGMRERCALLGGQLTAGPRPEGGFQVTARLPLKPVVAAHP